MFRGREFAIYWPCLICSRVAFHLKMCILVRSTFSTPFKQTWCVHSLLMLKMFRVLNICIPVNQRMILKPDAWFFLGVGYFIITKQEMNLNILNRNTSISNSFLVVLLISIIMKFFHHVAFWLRFVYFISQRIKRNFYYKTVCEKKYSIFKSEKPYFDLSLHIGNVVITESKCHIHFKEFVNILKIKYVRVTGVIAMRYGLLFAWFVEDLEILIWASHIHNFHL